MVDKKEKEKNYGKHNKCIRHANSNYVNDEQSFGSTTLRII